MRSRVFDFIDIEQYSATPKYQQLANCILNAVEVGKIKKDDLLPSINEMTYHLEVGKETVERSYKVLKQRGVLDSIPGKSFYIKCTDVKGEMRIMMLLNKMSTPKKFMYEAFVDVLKDKATVDLCFYNNSYEEFKRILSDRKCGYSYYVIMPHFTEKENCAVSLINSLPNERLVLLDKRLEGVRGNYASISENFEGNIYQSLEKMIERLRKYSQLNLFFPAHSYYPKEIIIGFKKFCNRYKFPYRCIGEISEAGVEKGSVYICLREEDLTTVILSVKEMELEAGKDIGLVCYNETPFMSIILNGITTISTDFKMMGRLAAEMLLDKNAEHLELPFHLILRGSL